MLRINLKDMKLKIRAPTITNIREGSQESLIVKNPMIFVILVIPDIIRPSPNIRPTI